MLARRQTVSSVIPPPPPGRGGGAAQNANICVASVCSETSTLMWVERTSAVRKHAIDQRLAAAVRSLSAGLCGFSASLSAGCGLLMVADVDSSRREFVCLFIFSVAGCWSRYLSGAAASMNSED